MKAFNKIGFHTSVGGNPRGIGDWMRALDAADIPFFIKAADSMTGLFDAQQIVRARQGAVPHTLVFRRSVHDGEDYDVPDYNKEPEAAAAEHWAKHKSRFPPELDPKLVWIETINEPRKEVPWADWLGHFAYYSAEIARADGYRFSAFGYSTGTPDEGAWDTDGMLRYLEYCQQHPHQASVALHEYSLVEDDIWFMRGDLVGRFEKLFQACDRHKIKRPYVLITEWGWTHERVPGEDEAIRHIREVGELYGRYPEILGAAIWYLGPGFGGIANLAQKLIQPVTDFTLQHTFALPDPEESKPKESAFPRPLHFRPAMSGSLINPNIRFIRDVTIPDDTRIITGADFGKTWRVENSGDTAWDNTFKLVFVKGTNMSGVPSIPMPKTAVGQQVDISIPMKAPANPGVYFSDWRLQDSKGKSYGDVIYVRIVAEKVSTPTQGVSDSKFVADVTIPDDTRVEMGQPFTKTWRAKNSGTRPWGAGFKLEFVGGTSMAKVTSIPLPAVAAGDEVNLSVEMQAPTTPGTHYADWRMKDDKGVPFGGILYVRIVVPSPAGESLAPPISQRDPLWVNTRLGHAGSPRTIGEWGCLMTCFAMTACTYGHLVTPAQLNTAMQSRGGFVDGYLTKWKALADVYNDIVYMGKIDGGTDILSRINDSLDGGNPVTVLVDFTRDTPYTDNDQHWVLIVGRNGDDYRINDPWLLPAQEASLRERYGRTGRPLQETIRSAIFYRGTRPKEIPQPPVVRLLERGMNINPDAPHSNPMDTDDLKGLEWVRFVFKLAARDNVAERGNLQIAFAQYDTLVRKYNQMGTKSLIVLNQETVWGRAPWTGNNDWDGYATELAEVARQIGQRYQKYGNMVAYEIWNEGDLPNNPASVFVPPDRFAIVLKKVAQSIRAVSPQSPLVFGGLATGPQQSIEYLQRCQKALNGPWPVDAIGIHPYGRWGTKAPFDWGQQFGTLADAFDRYRAALGDMPFWITEIGVAADGEIGPQYYAEIGDYIKDVYKHVEFRFTDLVPVLIWFGWSDWMRNAGIVDRNGNRKPHVYPAFRAVRNREL